MFGINSILARAAHGKAAGRGQGGAGLDADGLVRPGDNRPSGPPEYGKQMSRIFCVSTIKRNSMQTDGGTHRADDNRFFRGLLAGRQPLFLLGC